MDRLDDFTRIVRNGYADKDWKRIGENYRCPQCGEPLRGVNGKTSDGKRACYRFACENKQHYRTRWHTSWQGAYDEAAHDFEPDRKDGLKP